MSSNLRPTIIGSTQNASTGYRWSFVYAHGTLEEDLGYDAFTVDQPKPTPGGHMLTYRGKAVFCNIISEEDRKQGNGVSIAVYVDDAESIEQVLSGVTIN